MRSIFKRRQKYTVETALMDALLTSPQLKLRLQTLLDKKRVMKARNTVSSKLSTSFVTLEEGFQQFGNDLNKLQVRKDHMWRNTKTEHRNSNLLRSMRPPFQRY